MSNSYINTIITDFKEYSLHKKKPGASYTFPKSCLIVTFIWTESEALKKPIAHSSNKCTMSNVVIHSLFWRPIGDLLEVWNIK